MANNRFAALLLQRCPICLEGVIFRSFLGMHKDCPHCGTHFEREHGYFLNAMFFAYALGFVILAPSMLYLYLRSVSTFWFTVVVTLETLLLWPLVYRYSRVLWMHADQLLDPRRPDELPPSAQAYIAARQR
jgi:uncharacterized protein (DUF983 family)